MPDTDAFVGCVSDGLLGDRFRGTAILIIRLANTPAVQQLCFASIPGSFMAVIEF